MSKQSPTASNDPIPSVPLRPAADIMRLERIGAFHQTRISFVRSLVRRMARECWTITRDLADLDDNGFGTSVYGITTPAGKISFVAFTNYVAPEDRTDRVIAECWDATFTLCDHEATAHDIARLREHVPKQEAGRCSASEMVLSRSNRSVRLFDYVTDCLADGRQPDPKRMAAVGYLMRTTAVYGNGKFGISDFGHLLQHGIFSTPFQAEMLTVYIARLLSFDLVEHIARRRNPTRAVPLHNALKRMLGVGNATGLGMAPFLVAHPKLIHAWIHARELALARVRAVEHVESERLQRFGQLLSRAQAHVNQWTTDDPGQADKIEVLQRELADFESSLPDAGGLSGHSAHWDDVVKRTEARYSFETIELLNSLLLELYPELVDELERETGADEREDTAPQMTTRELKQIVEQHYDWALALDFTKPEAEHYFWYRSEEKEEPRFGERFNEPGADKELWMGIGREAAGLHRQLCTIEDDELNRPVAVFLITHPRWRGITRRIQSLIGHPYAEIRDNLLGNDCVPLHLLRCKLAMFGASKFDPKSNLWTRITLFQGAPLPAELASEDVDDWCFPIAPETIS